MNENRRRAARSGWTRRRGTASADPAHVGEDLSARDIEAVYAAYRAAKAKHDDAIAALRAARQEAPDPELIQRQAAAAVEEIEALTALRALVRSPMKPDEL